MKQIADLLVALAALEHALFLVLEMFLWTTPRGLKTFGLTREFAQQSKGLAANQGLYNGFLAAGLVWGLLHPDPVFGFQIKIFFLACVLVAAAFGAATVKKSILFVQGGPAFAALLLLMLGGRP